VEVVLVSRSWFDKIWQYSEINPGLEHLFDNFDLIQEEFRENLPKLMWREWGYSAGYTGQNKIAYDGWQVAGLYAQFGGYLDAGKWDDQSSIWRANPERYKPGSSAMEIPEFCGNQLEWTGEDFSKMPEGDLNFETVMPNTDMKIMFTPNCSLLPNLTRILYESGVRRRVGISVTRPGRGIGWHADRDPEGWQEMVIRGIIGLDVRIEEGEECYLGLGTPKQEHIEDIRSGKGFFFYSRVPHHVVNTMKHPRYCIILDHALNKENVKRINTQDKYK